MKNLSIFLCCSALSLVLGANDAFAQYSTCPHIGPSGSQVGFITWQFRDPDTGQVVSLAPHPLPDKVYQLEINYTGPAGKHYNATGFQGLVDGFKLYSSVNGAINSPDSYFTEDQISTGLAIDGRSSVWGIRTLPASDPNWSGQLTAFKAYGLCWESTLPGYPNKFYKKTLVFKQ